jgi:hypothetical protein
MHDLVEAGCARLVLGNHEIGALLTAAGLRRTGPHDTYTNAFESPDAEDWLRWLRELPLLESGNLGDTSIATLHASVNARWSLDEASARGGSRRGFAIPISRTCAISPRRNPRTIPSVAISSGSPDVAASMRSGAVTPIRPARLALSGTRPGRAHNRITPWCMDTGRSRNCTSRRACAVSTRGAFTTDAASTGAHRVAPRAEGSRTVHRRKHAFLARTRAANLPRRPLIPDGERRTVNSYVSER